MLPMVRVEKDYTFDGPDGPVTLAGLFGACRQLLVHHIMFDPDWDAACRSCTEYAKGRSGNPRHALAAPLSTQRRQAGAQLKVTVSSAIRSPLQCKIIVPVVLLLSQANQSSSTSPEEAPRLTVRVSEGGWEA
jgi:hypothetical protein